MKHKVWTLLIALLTFSILMMLTILSIVANNHFYARIGSTFIGLLSVICSIFTIKKDGMLAWYNGLILLLGVWFMLNPWLHLTG